MDSDFGDFDPEDAYDAGDPPDLRLTVIERVVEDLRARRNDNRFEARRTDLLRIIDNFLNEDVGYVVRLRELRTEVGAF